MAHLLELDDVVSHIAGTAVVRGISLNMLTGETLALIGRNGAGKTSLIRTIMGILPTQNGTIMFDGQEISRLPTHARPGIGIGYAPEDRRLIAKFTVHDNLMTPAWACRLPAKTINERLDLIYTLAPELQEMAGRLGGLLSGGQQKMVALARAIMAGDRLILLDEPFQGLAPALALRYADSLRQLRREKPDLAIIVAESNPKLLESMADRMVLIERGEIVSDESLQLSLQE